MGWFNKRSNEEKTKSTYSDEEIPELPELPRLPELPDLPEVSEEEDENEMTQLPIIPANSFGQRFSQNAIKEAVSGRGGGNRSSYTNEFTREEDEDMQGMQKPLRTVTQMEPPRKIETYGRFKEVEIPKIKTKKEVSYKEVPAEFKEAAKKVKSIEPVFIRIDKFQKALDILEETKEKILDMRKTLGEIKRIKDEEESELSSWDTEIDKLKAQIDKIDTDLFSKIE